MVSRILKETRAEADEFLKLGIISKGDHDEVVKLTARDLEIPEPVSFTGNRISKLRRKLSCSQKVFADIVGVTAGTVSKWERGEKTPEKPICRFLSALENHGISILGSAA